MKRTTSASVLGAALVAAAVVGTPGVATAAPTEVRVRMAHFTPDAPALDIYVDGRPALRGFFYRTVSPYVRMPAGTHRVDMRQAGSAATSQPLATATATVAAGGAATIAAMGIAADMSGHVFADDLTTPPAGSARVKAIHAIHGVPPADAVVNSSIAFKNVSFATASANGTLPGGVYDVQMRRAGTSEVLLAAKGIAVRAGTVYTLAAIGGSGKPVELVPIIDATGAGLTPRGGAATGGGGTAPGSLPVAPAIAVTVGLGALALGTARASRRSAL